MPILKVDWRPSAQNPFDSRGIPLLIVPYTGHYCYSPMIVGMYSEKLLNQYRKEANEGLLVKICAQAEWLCENIEIDSRGFGIWRHEHKNVWYNAESGWTSALTQGRAISVLSGVYKITGLRRYLDIANLALLAFEYNLSDGGLHFSDESGNIWLEEMAINPPPHILNGFIETLFHLFDYHKQHGSLGALGIWKEGICTIINNINRFDLGFWSAYDLVRTMPAPLDYHHTHISQLHKLKVIEGNAIFSEYEDLWQNQLDNYLCRLKANYCRTKCHIEKHGFAGSLLRGLDSMKWRREFDRCIQTFDS